MRGAAFYNRGFFEERDIARKTLPFESVCFLKIKCDMFFFKLWRALAGLLCFKLATPIDKGKPCCFHVQLRFIFLNWRGVLDALAFVMGVSECSFGWNSQNVYKGHQE